jgi:hypothetical protein
VIQNEATVARELLAAARMLSDQPTIDTRGLWPRAAVLLTRQSLEVALKTYWSAKAPGVEDASMRAQLLCLGTWISDESLARRANQVWSALSRASHHHPYELTPTRDELVVWFATVLDVIEKTERTWRKDTTSK